MNTDRKQIPIERDIQIEESGFVGVSKDQMMKAVSQMKEGEVVVSLQRRKGTAEVWGGDESSQGAYYNYPVLVVQSLRPETDEEYFQRMKNDEAAQKAKEEEERRQYLRLKAKFEYDGEPTDQQIENMNTQ